MKMRMRNAECNRPTTKPQPARAGWLGFVGRTLWLGGLAGVAALLPGCSHTPPVDPFAGEPGSVFAPQPPPFVRGSMALLLTNAGGFSAHVSMEPPLVPTKRHEVSGQLWGRGGKLLFAQDPGESKRKHPVSEGLSFIWDTVSSTGFVLSEPLQGYAPVSSRIEFTNIAIRAARAASTNIDGRSCEWQQVAVSSGEGADSVYEVWRAVDLRGLPLRITENGKAGPRTVTISKVRLGAPPEEIFQPPPAFTRYASVEAMMTELAIREQSFRSGHPSFWGERPSEDQEHLQPPRGY